MKTETFEQFKAWLKTNTPAPGHTFDIQTADINGWVNEDAEYFADTCVDCVVNRYADFIRVGERDENGKLVGEVAYFANNGKKPYGEAMIDEDEEDY